MNLPTPMRAAVVVQTHWDREWYFPHQQYLARLLTVMSRVVTQLESGALSSFLFDGQTAAYEDLLANGEPELVARVQALVRDKRIVVGPWYVMADEFLVSGESLWRNLELGMADAARAGNGQRVGYLPDTFGHVSQMPQMLRAFGIDCAVMWRGVDAAHSEFDWVAPDGSRVGTLFLTQGYYQHPFNVPQWQTALTQYLNQVASRTLASRILLTQGGDHLVSVENLGAKLDEFNRSQSAFVLEQMDLEHYTRTTLAETAGQRTAIHGALRDNAQAFVLPDVLSTRRYLKLENQLAEDRLTGLIEPMFVALDIDDAPQRYLEQCWRLLIQNQAHDSICGCSVDAVHREMLTRYAQLQQRCDALVSQACAAAGMIAVAQHGGSEGLDVFTDDTAFTLFNPQPKAFSGVVVVRVFIKGAQHTGLTINTVAGDILQSELLSTTAAHRFISPIDDFPDRLAGFEYEVAVQVKLEGLAALSCVASLGARADVSKPSTTPSLTQIENAHLRVVLSADGTLSVTDKKRGRTMDRFLSVLHEHDAGDSYNFSPPKEQRETRESRFQLVAVQARAQVPEMRLRIEMRVPAALRDDRIAGSAETVTNHGELRLRLLRDVIDCQLSWTNQARDQRTRLLLPIQDVDATYADSAFSWERYPVVHAAYPAVPSRREMPVAVMPTLSAIVAGDVGFAHRAMQEYEVLKREAQHFLGVTLVRSVGWMSRRDLVTRGVGAGPDMETPEAQCIGTSVFEFRVGFPADPVSWLNHAAHFRRPPVMLRGHSACWLPPQSFASALQVSATRRVGTHDEVRLWNPTAKPQPLHAIGWQRVEPNALQPVRADECVPPHGMVTLRRARSSQSTPTPPRKS
jgi:mannosylglycerate hydrolase